MHGLDWHNPFPSSKHDSNIRGVHAGACMRDLSTAGRAARLALVGTGASTSMPESDLTLTFQKSYTQVALRHDDQRAPARPLRGVLLSDCRIERLRERHVEQRTAQSQ